MRKHFDKNTYLYPMPVLIIGTYDKNGIANAMNAAWGGIYDDNQITICLSTNHKTTDNIKLHKEFSVAFATSNTIEISDYVGIVSGNDVDKIRKANLHVIKSDVVNAPIFDEYPLTIECRLVDLQDDGTTTHVIADIIGISADESILTNNKVDVEKLSPIAYDPACHTYYKIDKIVGHAFKDGLKLK